MAVYKYGDPDPENQWGNRKFAYDSLINDKISRFFWSWFDDCDLHRLKNIPPEKMSVDEQTAWNKGHRLLDFRRGDWVIHKNVPERGKCTAVRLSGEYFYKNPPVYQNDGRQCFDVDRIFTFSLKDERVHPLFRSKVNVMGALTRIYDEKEFYESLIALGYKIDETDKKRLAELNVYTENIDENHFKRAVNEILEDLTRVIQNNHPDKELERFLGDVIRKIPGVKEVKNNGFGWGSDHGADLIVKTEKNLIVVQVKSYVGEVWANNCVEQLKEAIEHFKATKGIIITTGQSTPALDSAVKKLAKEMSKKNIEVRLIFGVGFAKFVLKYGLDLLI